MTKFFLALIATSVVTLIGAIVIATFRVPDPFLHRPPIFARGPFARADVHSAAEERRTVGLTIGPFLARRRLSCDFGQSR